MILLAAGALTWMMGSLSPMMVCTSVMSPDTKKMQPMTRAKSPSVPPCAAASADQRLRGIHQPWYWSGRSLLSA